MEVQKKNLGSKEIDIEYRYAWDWFSYHASQRLIAFRYFLLIIGAIFVGYSTCLANKIFWPSVIICLFGIFISVAFFFLEIRNEELVNCGREALDEIEKKIEVSIRKRDETRRCLKKSLEHLFIFRCFIPRKMSPLVRKRVEKITRHRYWLRAIYSFTSILFLALTILTLLGIIPS